MADESTTATATDTATTTSDTLVQADVDAKDTSAQPDSDTKDTTATEVSKSDDVKTDTPKTDDEIMAAYEAGEPLTRNEIDRRDAIIEERRIEAQTRQQQQAWIENLVPNTVKGIIEEDLAALNLNLDPRDLRILQADLEKRLDAVAKNGRDAFGLPFVNLQARNLVNTLKDSGMNEKEALDTVFGPKRDGVGGVPLGEMVKTAFEAGKKSGGLKASDVTPEWVEKNAKATYDAIEQKFHEKWPERGGGGKPADGGRAPASLTKESYTAMTPDERLKLWRERPDEVRRLTQVS